MTYKRCLKGLHFQSTIKQDEGLWIESSPKESQSCDHRCPAWSKNKTQGCRAQVQAAPDTNYGALAGTAPRVGAHTAHCRSRFCWTQNQPVCLPTCQTVSGSLASSLLNRAPTGRADPEIRAQETMTHLPARLCRQRLCTQATTSTRQLRNT